MPVNCAFGRVLLLLIEREMHGSHGIWGESWPTGQRMAVLNWTAHAAVTAGSYYTRSACSAVDSSAALVR